ncbi:FmdB family zinc ribbon protein [Modestobacter versicolor]|uniref:FmdB family zinc ribbon protein n=1 Tax=Modestobacter versicolor TaxID=429133 RepID=UPI0034DE9D7E
MPTYQYVCTNPEGKHEFEVVQSFTDAAVATCPECGAPVRKVYGSVGVVFKGSGFYRTDSRKAESAATPATGKDSGSKDSGSSSKESSTSGSGGASKDSAGSSSTPSTSAASTSTGGKAAN